MGREWDRKRKIDELLKSYISADMKKDLEAEREEIKIQLKRKQARNRRNRLSRCSIVLSVVPPPPPITADTTAAGQPITFTVSINGKTGPPATVVNM